MTGARDVLLIPCWRRPEFLWHCLDNLLRAEQIEHLHVLFRPDTGHDRSTLEVIDEYAPRLASYEINVPVACPYRHSKQSANLLGGYLLAAAQTRRYVFMVEEDVMVARDFLRWHYVVHAAQPRLFCSIGVRNPHRTLPENDDPQIYYLSSDDYCSLGVCFERSVLLQLVGPHVRREYFEDPGGYCQRHFPGFEQWADSVGQEGLLRRIQASNVDGRPIAYPYRPRGFHGGYESPQRRGASGGSLRDRIRQVGQVIYNPEAMRAAAGESVDAIDSAPVSLDTPPWDGMRYQALPASAENLA